MRGAWKLAGLAVLVAGCQGEANLKVLASPPQSEVSGAPPERPMMARTDAVPEVVGATRATGEAVESEGTRLTRAETKAAKVALEKGDLVLAEKLARQATTRPKERVETELYLLQARKVLGKVLMEKGDYEGALEAMKRPNNHWDAESDADLAYCNLRLGRLEQAKKHYLNHPVEKFDSSIDPTQLPTLDEEHGLEIRILVARGIERTFRSMDRKALDDLVDAHKLAPRNPEIARVIERIVPTSDRLPWCAIMSVYGKGKTKERGTYRLNGFPQEQIDAALAAAKKL